MQDLDRPELWQEADPRAMKDLVASFPAQMRAARGLVGNLRLLPRDRIDNVIVAGMGGSAIGGEIARAAASDRLQVPLAVQRDYALPAFADARTLVIASSYSGNTEETLQAVGEARRAGAAVACVTSGGELARLAAADRMPLVLIPPGLPPRAALGYSTVAILGLLRAAGVIGGIDESLAETESLLDALGRRWQPEIPESANPAKQLARSLHGRIAAIYGSAGLLEPAAYRWRCQIEENAKNLALHHALPEMNHNELVGWEMKSPVLERIGVVMLRDREDHPQVRRRFDLTCGLLTGRCGALHQVWTEGTSRLARIFSAVYLGDFVSLYLAYLNGVDPTPVEVIEYLKRELSR